MGKLKRKFVLRDGDDIIGIFRIIDGAKAIVTSVESWENGVPLDESFHSHSTVKWDGCSHIDYRGEDYPEDKDFYYHLCGLYYYERFHKLNLFSYACWTKLNSEKGYTETHQDENSILKDQLDRMDIEEVPFTEEDLGKYKSYL